MSIYQVFAKGVVKPKEKIILREEQKEAIEKAKKVFSKKIKEGEFHKYLWNAKMRFGKTLCALQLAKDMDFKRTLIVTHRPIVNEGWKDDFNNIFDDVSFSYKYGTKFEKEGEGNFYDLENFVNSKDSGHYVFFVSMQYLCRAREINENGIDNQLKSDILNNNWDFVVVDEAHEGTRTSLGKSVINKLSKTGTCVLHLSGTPFNLYDDFKGEEIYTWDYISEQKAKLEWFQKHPDEPEYKNPYYDLPKMNIFTYDLGNLVNNIANEENAAFKFSEFFRVWTGDEKRDGAQMPDGRLEGHFIHEDAVKEFLDLLCKEDDANNYPFSKEEYQEAFKHTLWIVPGVKQAAALTELLRSHETFSGFTIVNVAGNSEDAEHNENALDKLKEAIGNVPEETSTITISCGRLTTGTTIPPWTAVFYLKGSDMTSAATYMQTIFRVQTPYHTPDHRYKAGCFVFDFAPDRSLKMVAETAKFARKLKKEKTENSSQEINKEDDLTKMQEFLNFCPVISWDGGVMKSFDEQKLFAQLDNVLIDRIARNGFYDNALYDTQFLMNLDDASIAKLNLLKETISKSTLEIDKKKNNAQTSIQMAQNGMSDQEIQTAENAEKKKKKNKHLTPEEKAALDKLKKKREEERKERNNRIAILRGISLRIPLMIFGGRINRNDKQEDKDACITVDNITDVVDDESWNEFMPKGVTKEDFNAFKKCYNAGRFAEAGKRYREWAQMADDQTIDERIKTITTIHSYFHNPDKETVLTPWRVVNMHLSNTLGGYCFFNKAFDGPNLNEDGEETTTPRWVGQPEDSEEISDAIFKQVDPGSGKSPVRILEINSKTGLYPLYMAYSLYRSIRPVWLKACNDPKHPDAKEESALWDQILQENIFVICNTPMAAQITERTLRGFRDVPDMHIRDINLIEKATRNQEELVKKLNSEQFWFKNESSQEMKFSAIVGNPPYQGTNHQQIYPFFYLLARELSIKYVSLIFPTGWQEPKDANNLSKLNNEAIKRDKQIHFIDNRENIFPNVSGAQYTNIILWEKDYNNGLDGAQLIYNNGKDPEEKILNTKAASKPVQILALAEIIKKSDGFSPVQTIMSMSKPYGIRKNVFNRCAYYNLPEMDEQQLHDTDIKVFGSKNSVRFIPADYPLPKKTSAMMKFKVFVGSAWGNMSEKNYLGGAFANVRIGRPNEICTETYQESGSFDTYDMAYKHAKFLLTKFARACLYVNKISQMSTAAWGAVPVQDYSESWWERSVAEIDEELFKKYSIPEGIRDFIRKNFQGKTVENID